MITDAYIVLVLLLAGIALFSIGQIRVDMITAGLLAILMATGILSPAEAFAGFGSDFVVILASIFVISGALKQSGILDQLGSRLIRQARMHPGYLSAWIMITVGSVSAFMNNTTVTAIFISPVISLARRMNTRSSKLLMSVAYAAILGGTCTLIGTSTNIAVNGYLLKNGFQSFGMFEFLPVGLVLFIVGILYMTLIGRHLLPEHPDDNVTEEFGLHEYVSEIVITEKSPLIGQKIFHSNLSKTGFQILNMIREGASRIPDEFMTIRANDMLIVKGNVDDLMRVKETEGIEIRGDILPDQVLQGDQIKLAEVLVTPLCDFVNTSLKRASFRQKYGLVVIAIKRSGQTISNKLGAEILLGGDILLVQGTAERIDYYKSNRDITILDDFKPMLYKKRKGLFTIFIFTLAIVIGSSGLLPLAAALMIAALLVVSTAVISPSQAYESIDMKLLIMIGGMAAFGTALTKTGAAALLSEEILHYLEPLGPLAIINGFILLTVLLTMPMSNAAAALVVLPIALETAQHLHANPKSFAIAVMLSASISLITPFEPACMLVFGPGKYRFWDYFKTGLILTVLLILVLMVLIPYFWPL